MSRCKPELKNDGRPPEQAQDQKHFALQRQHAEMLRGGSSNLFGSFQNGQRRAQPLPTLFKSAEQRARPKLLLPNEHEPRWWGGCRPRTRTPRIVQTPGMEC